MSAAPVTAVIVNWNGRHLLTPCIESVRRQDLAGGVAVTVVDNGSTDGSVELLRERFPAVTLLCNEPNNYTAANNLAVRSASTDLVLLLNTDATLAPDCVRILVDAVRDPAVAGAAAKVLYPDGRLYSTGILETDDLYWIDRHQGEPEKAAPGSVEDVFGISGCCALFRREAWLRAGGQDEEFHMYYEDVDLSLRLRRLGYRLRFVPAARVTHVGHASVSAAPFARERIGDRNRLLVLATHYPDRFTELAAHSNWFRSATREEALDLLPKLARRLGIEESEIEQRVTRYRRDHPLPWRARWSLRRRLRKIWSGITGPRPRPGRP